ncbi:TNF receptor-associated factor 6-like [Elysia marginata]|uniref:TNF receptor-associated factor 6-like n=1 Tax=Elysia marginata TaxID=1093978 RepID=A0AAV4GXH5_9GAST|nr:TNF receptor-associated factor 6-like [Elysia marginata]
MTGSGVIRTNRLLICPVDKTISEVSKIFPDIATRREILSLRLTCNNSERSCTWTGELRDLESHNEVCLFQEVKCPNHCRAKVLRRDMDTHAGECPARLVHCRYCHAQVVFNSLKAHIETCPKVKVSCSVCHKAQIRREDIRAHTDPVEGDCPMVTTKCPYSHLGCDYKAERYQVERHTGQVEVLQHHLGLASQMIYTNGRKLEALEKKLEQLQTKHGEFQPTVQNVQRRQDQITRDAHLRNVTGRLHWKVKLSRSHNRARNTSYCSPAFYTGCPGYKVQLTLHMEGFREGREWYATLGLGLLPGDYDESLVFPFNGTCYATICDQSENLTSRQNYEQQVVLRQVPRVTRPGHSGLSRRAITKFLSRRDLIGPSSKYMRNGCLHFEVTVLHSVVPEADTGGAVSRHCLCSVTPSNITAPTFRTSVWHPTPVLPSAQQQQQQQQHLQVPANNTPVSQPTTSETSILPHPSTRMVSVAALALQN